MGALIGSMRIGLMLISTGGGLFTALDLRSPRANQSLADAGPDAALAVGLLGPDAGESG